MEFIQPITATDCPPDDELLRYWSLTLDDLRFVSNASTLPSLRVWLGLQLCFLRIHGTLARHAHEFPPKTIPSRLEKQAFSLLPSNLLVQLEQILSGKFAGYPDLFNELRATPPFPSRKQFYQLVSLEKSLRPVAIASRSLDKSLSSKLIKEYAKSARRWSLWEIKRFSREKRSIILACYIIDAQANLIDTLVQMFDRLVTRMENRVEASWEEFVVKKRQTNQANRKIILRAAEIFASSTANELISAHKNFDLEALKKALNDRSARGDGDDDDKAVIMGRMVQKFRPILRQFLHLDLQVAKGLDNLQKALELAGEASGPFISQDAPHFIEQRYRSCAKTEDGHWRRDIWEWFLIQEIRTRLRAQDIYFPSSIKNRGFWNSLVNIGVPLVITNPKAISAIDDLRMDFERELRLFKESLPNNQFVKIVDGAIQLSRDRAEPDPVPDSLRAKILSTLGRIRIEDLLASAAENISADMLEDLCRGYLSQENIKEAIHRVVDYQASLEAGNVYGTGEISSSDGQLFAVRGKSLLVEYHPRRFGWLKRGVNVYCHLSDRYTVFSSIVLSCSTREWLAVIDGLMDNDTALHPRIHTTDTHGYTDNMFALSWLLGFMFAPRIRDAGGTRLWLPEGLDAGELSSIFQPRRVSLQSLRENWDLAQRVISALKQKLVDGRTICMRLTNSSSDPLANALLDAGRIIKSTFLLRWMRDPDFRRPLNAQLNKGEARQDLARSINFASGSGLRSADPTDLMNRTSVLALACNIIVAWNTRRVGDLLADMKVEKSLSADIDLSSISPLMHEHIIRTGTYRFRQQENQDAYTN